MTKIIGLTGGIGSGKTTIAQYFKSLDIPVYIADEEAKKLLDNPIIQDRIKVVFGETIIEKDKVSREKLASIVFQNPQKLSALNAIIHPAVKEHFQNWLTQHQNNPIVIKEAAILFESGSYQDCDKIITVVAPLETRIERVIARDKTTKDDVLNRIKNQWADEMRIAKSDFIIDNNDLSSAKLQVDKILKKLTNP
ncbi:dephospho-CoA kinase [Flavobacterium sp.]|uniref:dephospho-CoA kinase n=1 Tax=Flavobacterium sp. TaxID=239 RepID=UPI00286C4CAA|nr:dephospho-CoA kinase [Flavobacterium sp.]